MTTRTPISTQAPVGLDSAAATAASTSGTSTTDVSSLAQSAASGGSMAERMMEHPAAGAPDGGRGGQEPEVAGPGGAQGGGAGAQGTSTNSSGSKAVEGERDSSIQALLHNPPIASIRSGAVGERPPWQPFPVPEVPLSTNGTDDGPPPLTEQRPHGQRHAPVGAHLHQWSTDMPQSSGEVSVVRRGL